MDDRGRAFDNIFVERLWRVLTYEDIYIPDYPSIPALTRGLEACFYFYSHERYDHRWPGLHGTGGSGLCG